MEQFLVEIRKLCNYNVKPAHQILHQSFHIILLLNNSSQLIEGGNMSDQFWDLSFPFIMDLYCTKKGAEKRGDDSAIKNLKVHYPELFTDKFNTFISNLEIAVNDLDDKYDQNFASMLEPNPAFTRKVN